MSGNILYKCENVGFEYQLGNQRVRALEDVSFSVRTGDFVCLSGPSGSGKSTLLNLLGLIEPVQTGKVTFNNEEIASMSEKKLNHLRRHQLGFIFQAFNLIDVLSAEENVEYFLTRQGVSSKERGERVREALEAVGLWEHKEKRPLEMSGGQRQRVAIARAVAKKPNVIIADEPTASLDQKTGSEIVDTLVELNSKHGVTIITASHDPMVLEKVPSHWKLMDGKIVSGEAVR